jgi:hypothetical protein
MLEKAMIRVMMGIRSYPQRLRGEKRETSFSESATIKDYKMRVNMEKRNKLMRKRQATNVQGREERAHVDTHLESCGKEKCDYLRNPWAK